MSLDLETVRQHAVDAARQAGDVLMRYFQSPTLKVSQKAIRIDLITEADHAAEELIMGFLKPLYPEHHFVGEESGGSGAPIETAAYRWHIDPLDGTVNFAHGIPIFSVSIALSNQNNEPLVGVVYHPVLNEMYSAVLGGGAMLNDKPISVSTLESLGDAMISSGFPYNKGTAADNNLAQWSAVVPRIAAERRLGSAAVDLTYVAVGRLDAYWEMNLNTWDVMAGMLIVREAGGRVTDYRGSDSGAIGERCHLVATNGLLHESLLAVLKESGSPLAR